jgi:hypothetical protein
MTVDPWADPDGCEQDLWGHCNRCDNEDNDYDGMCQALADEREHDDR